jgi:hypothetical protein
VLSKRPNSRRRLTAAGCSPKGFTRASVTPDTCKSSWRCWPSPGSRTT